MNLPTASDIFNTGLETNSLTDTVIELENVSVSYTLPYKTYVTLKEYSIHLLQGKVKNRSFQALHDVNLSINKGEVFGVIGRNGAGKSTLLKLIAKVLRRPTAGRVIVRGRVAPLLHVGAGFHADLTGRENVYLNGALLGFNRSEMQEKIDRIVDFAEIGDFIDAPLDTYSTGMVARLGFAIATDVQPDILLVDEVLGVGDEAFMRKCNERIHSFQKNGATILLVSHALGTIESLCSRAALLSHGHVEVVGNPADVITQYQELLGRSNE